MLHLAAGLGCLLGGTLLLGRSLRRGTAWGALPRSLLGAMAAGALAAAVLQSASACAIGLVAASDAGLELALAWAALLGADIGGTALPHIVGWRVPGAVLALVAATGGAALAVPRLRRAGALALAGALLLGGFHLLSAAGGGLDLAPAVLRGARGPLWAALAGVVSTAVLFSSGFTIGVAQGLVAGGGLPLAGGLAFVAGANLGTTSDVLAASLATGWRGRATAAVQLGCKLLLAAGGLLCAGAAARRWAAWGLPPVHALAHWHTLLNVVAALGLLPCLRPLARWAEARLGIRR